MLRWFKAWACGYQSVPGEDAQLLEQLKPLGQPLRLVHLPADVPNSGHGVRAGRAVEYSLSLDSDMILTAIGGKGQVLGQTVMNVYPTSTKLVLQGSGLYVGGGGWFSVRLELSTNTHEPTSDDVPWLADLRLSGAGDDWGTVHLCIRKPQAEAGSEAEPEAAAAPAPVLLDPGLVHSVLGDQPFPSVSERTPTRVWGTGW